MLKAFLKFLGWTGWAELIYGQVRNGGRTLYLARLPLTPSDMTVPWRVKEHPWWSPKGWKLVDGQLLWHVFYRGDEDPDPHDHPWDFWTFPLSAYYEEVMDHEGTITLQLVPAWRWSFRSWAYTHRVMYPRYSAIDGACLVDNVAIPERYRGPDALWPLHTLVWRSPYCKVTWGFWVLDRINWYVQSNPCTTGLIAGKSRMKVPWRTYIYGHEQREPI